MKKMRKVAGMLMAATVAMAMPMSAMAASITVNGAFENETCRIRFLIILQVVTLMRIQCLPTVHGNLLLKDMNMHLDRNYSL